MTSDSRGSRGSHARKVCDSILDAITDAIVIFDPRSFQILDVNKKASEVYGYSRRELVGEQVQKLSCAVPYATELPYPTAGIEAIHITSHGEKIDMLISLSVIQYWGRKAVLSINRDIREMKRIQASLAAGEKKFRLLIQNISEIVALIDEKGIVRFISPQSERVLGLSPGEIVGHDVFEFIHPEEHARAHAEYEKTLHEPGENIPSILKFRDALGKWVPFEVIANNQLSEPDIGAVVFTARDLRYRRELEDAVRRSNAELDRRVEERTMELARANAALRLENRQRRFAERQLDESVSLLNATLESTADGILVISNDGSVRSYNQKFVEMWRIPASILNTMTDEALLRWATPQVESPQEFRQNVEKLYAASSETSFDTLRFKDGRVFERYSQPQRVDTRIVGRVWSFRDVTVPRSQQEELQQVKKMEAVGRLAGGVAHDFNNVLMLISGYAAQLVQDPGLPDSARALSNDLAAAAKRGASLTSQLLAFSRRHPLTPKVIDLNKIVSDMQNMLPRLLSTPIFLNVNLHREPLLVFVDRSQIELVIINLVLNARDAMPEGGTLSITTKEEVLDFDKVADVEGRNRYVVLQVRDTGHGMAPDISARIFEPFFTTKELGKGTGLGLSTVYGIIEQSAGHITVDSEPERGTTFCVYFPWASLPAVTDETAPRPSPARGNETILLVEDEEGIRTMTAAYLQSLGYKVMEGDDGPAAIRISQDYPGTINLLLTDILMPGMRGDELSRLLTRERPGLLTIFISGYANVHDRDPHIPVLEKPFTFPDLGHQVRLTLDAPPAGVGGQRVA